MKLWRLKFGVLLFTLLCLWLPFVFFSRSKEHYLHRHERIINHVKANHATFSERDWARFDRQVNNFYNALTRRFYDRLSYEEKANGMIVYNSLRYGDGFVKDEAGCARRIFENQNVYAGYTELARRIERHQEQIFLELELLRRQVMIMENQLSQVINELEVISLSDNRTIENAIADLRVDTVYQITDLEKQAALDYYQAGRANTLLEDFFSEQRNWFLFIFLLSIFLISIFGLYPVRYT